MHKITLSPPLPGGKGESQSLFRRGLRPRHPGAEPLTALTETAVQVPYVGKPAVRRKSKGKRLPIVSPVPRVPRPVQPRGCKGRSPLHKITLSPPLPGGKGESQSLFRRGLRPRHPGAEPLTALTETAVQVPYVGKPAVRRKSKGKRLPIVSPVPRVPRPVQPRGCKGRSPLHKITLSLPLPAGKGAGGMGAGK